MATSKTDIDSRSKDILRAVIEGFLETGEPVGSRTLARRLGLHLSPATIRNVMADLQESGLLFAPHASAGRLPTDAGLRLFVDGLLQIGHLSASERESIEVRCQTSGRTVEQVLGEATRTLSGLSNCAGLVLAPKSDNELKHLEFVHLGPGRALVILVMADGRVENRLIDVPVGLPASSLIEATNFLSAQLVGKTIDQARSRIQVELETDRHNFDKLTRELVEAGLATWSGDDGNRLLIVSGADKLLDDVRAVEDLERVRSLFAALDTKEGLVRLLDATAQAEGVQIFIGAQNELFGLAGCSVIVAPYADSEQQIVGAIGVIGPTRINYARIIPVVDYTARIVGKVLA